MEVLETEFIDGFVANTKKPSLKEIHSIGGKMVLGPPATSPLQKKGQRRTNRSWKQKGHTELVSV